ncbi:MAG: DNA-binding protein [Campylobacterota bacterium]
MNEYEFELVFKLPFQVANMNDITDKLFKAGCDDATVSFNKMGIMTLSFDREAVSAKEAVESAVENVKEALPEAILVEASPDYVTITEISSYFGTSRQNTRKLFEKDMPIPVHVGKPSMWHLSNVLEWFKNNNTAKAIDNNLFEIAQTNKAINSQRQTQRL